jgi:hypothetical protein
MLPTTLAWSIARLGVVAGKGIVDADVRNAKGNTGVTGQRQCRSCLQCDLSHVVGRHVRHKVERVRCVKTACDPTPE